MENNINEDKIYETLDRLSGIDFSEIFFNVLGKKVEIHRENDDLIDTIYFSLPTSQEKIEFKRVAYYPLEKVAEEIRYDVSVGTNLKKRYIKNGNEKFILIPDLAVGSKIYLENNDIKKVEYKQYNIFKNDKGKLISQSVAKGNDKKGYFNGEQYFIISQNSIERANNVKVKNKENRDNLLDKINEAKEILYINNGDNNQNIAYLNRSLEDFISNYEKMIINFSEREDKEIDNLVNVIKHVETIFKEFHNYEVFPGLKDAKMQEFINIFANEVNKYVNKYECEREIEKLSNINFDKLSEKQKQYILRRLGAYDNLEDDCK